MAIPGGPAHTARGGVVSRLPYRPPLQAGALLGWLAARAAPGVEAVSGGVYRRSLRLPNSTAVAELSLTGDDVTLRLHGADPADLPAARALCRRAADLDTDPAEVDTALAADPLLAPMVAARPGLRVPGTVDGFELACRAILGQQITVAGARTLAGRMVAAFGRPLPVPRGQISHLFPTADRLAGASQTDLTGLGLTRARAGALLALAGAVAGGRLVLDRGADHHEATRRLLALPGVGPWTAAYVAMRALGDTDALPAGDLILRRALPGAQSTRGAQRGQVTAAALTAHAARWRPFRAYAAVHLWANTVDPGDDTGGTR